MKCTGRRDTLPSCSVHKPLLPESVVMPFAFMNQQPFSLVCGGRTPVSLWGITPTSALGAAGCMEWGSLEGQSLPWLQRWFLRCPCHLDRPNGAKGIEKSVHEPVETFLSVTSDLALAGCGSELRLVIAPRPQSRLRARQVSGNGPHRRMQRLPKTCIYPLGFQRRRPIKPSLGFKNM